MLDARQKNEALDLYHAKLNQAADMAYALSEEDRELFTRLGIIVDGRVKIRAGILTPQAQLAYALSEHD